jgi:hypothetical protein
LKPEVTAILISLDDVSAFKNFQTSVDPETNKGKIEFTLVWDSEALAKRTISKTLPTKRVYSLEDFSEYWSKIPEDIFAIKKLTSQLTRAIIGNDNELKIDYDAIDTIYPNGKWDF